MSSQIKMLIDGTVSIAPQLNGDLELTINGTYTNDDINDAKLIESIGYFEVVEASDKNDLLAEFKVSDMIEHIISGCDRNDVREAYEILKKECDVYDLSS